MHLRLRSPRDTPLALPTNVLLLRWDTKPDKRIRRTFLRHGPTRRTTFLCRPPIQSSARRNLSDPVANVPAMDFRLELVQVPVSDVDRAKTFYTEKAGFVADHDHRVNDEIRFVQLTPPGSAASIAIGTGLGAAMSPG